MLPFQLKFDDPSFPFRKGIASPKLEPVSAHYYNLYYSQDLLYIFLHIYSYKYFPKIYMPVYHTSYY